MPASGGIMANKRKAFVVFANHSGGDDLKELNKLLEAGWLVKDVHQSASASGNFPSWFVVAEKVDAE